MKPITSTNRFWAYLLLAAAMLAGTSCDLLEFSPNDHRVPEEFTNLTQKNLARLLARPLPPEDTLRFVFTGDSQRFYDEADDLVKSVNQRPGVQFVLLAGDVSDFGTAREMRWVDEKLRRLRIPYLTVVGNHDLIGNGRAAYQQLFGALNYSFVYGDTKFTLIDTNSREYNFDGQVPNIPWMQTQLSDSEGASRQIVMCHVPPDNEDFDPKMRYPFVQALRQTPNLALVLNGHNHSYRIGHPFGDGITYLNSDAFSERHYMVVTVWGNKQFRVERVAF